MSNLSANAQLLGNLEHTTAELLEKLNAHLASKKS